MPKFEISDSYEVKKMYKMDYSKLNPSICINFLFHSLTEFINFKKEIENIQNKFIETKEGEIKEKLISFESNLDDNKKKNDSSANNIENNQIRILDLNLIKNENYNEEKEEFNPNSEKSSNDNLFKITEDEEKIKNKNIFQLKPIKNKKIEEPHEVKRKDSFLIIDKENKSKQKLLLKSLFTGNGSENENENRLIPKSNFKYINTSSSNSVSQQSDINIFKKNKKKNDFKITKSDLKIYSNHDNFINLSEQNSESLENNRKYSDFTNIEYLEEQHMRKGSERSKESDFLLVADGNSNPENYIEIFPKKSKLLPEINSEQISQKHIILNEPNDQDCLKMNKIMINFRRNRRIFSNTNLRKFSNNNMENSKNYLSHVNSTENLILTKEKDFQSKTYKPIDLFGTEKNEIKEESENFRIFCRGESNSLQNLENNITEEQNSFEDNFPSSKYNSIENSEENSIFT